MSIFGLPEKLVNRALETFDLVDATIRDIRATVNNVNQVIVEIRAMISGANTALEVLHKSPRV